MNDITVTEDRRITKPGICPEKHHEVSKENLKKITYKTKSHLKRVKKIRNSVKEHTIERKALASKAVMQACNLHRIKD